MKKPKGCITYENQIDMVLCLDNLHLGELMAAVFRYFKTGELPELSENYLKGMFASIKNSMDSDIEKYDKKCRKYAENASKRKTKEAASAASDSEQKADSSEQVSYAEYVSMTEKEHQKLIAEFGEGVTADYIKKLNNHKGSTGKTYANDYYTMKSWIEKDQNHQQKAEQETPSSYDRDELARFWDSY